MDFLADRERLRAEAMDAVRLAQAKMKLSYDSKHTVPVFNTGWAYLKLAKKGDTGYHLQNQTKLSARKIGPFPVLEVNPLSCKLDLPDWLGGPNGIHPVISVEHLEPAKPDLYQRKQPESGPIIIDGVQKFIIDKIINREVRSTPGKPREIFYEVRWLNYEDTTWEPRASLIKDVPKLVLDFERAGRS